uniref:Uncharacterized protein n=1 Tax=Thermosporothrix sp. COM3 TaxID=2490863 RepID=A0A455SP53_9CHLR|nr:hypothetical protein KTC_48530 [Thermosporothrix sp. COM3]BBH90167.1 hypothetical protein KTC_49180 [Thermosporothrix sp. COM3]BBH90232.1 hypothetical protein KTC_49830 [Thermosporothrix sp. COM3]
MNDVIYETVDHSDEEYEFIYFSDGSVGIVDIKKVCTFVLSSSEVENLRQFLNERCKN